MATEKRLIDANALCEKIGNMKSEITHTRGGYRYCNEAEKNEWDKLDSFDSLVCDTPTVDAVEVVRCEKCLFFDRYIDHRRNVLNFGRCRLHDTEINQDDFCSYGERKKDGDL